MSKNKRNIKLKIGRFYNVRDGSDKGHPGRIFNINYKNGEYDSIVTETTYRKGLIPINPTDNRVKHSYIKPNPFRGTRNDYGNKEYTDMKFDNDALKKSSKVKNKPFVFGHHYKKKYRINKKMGINPSR